MKKLLTAWPNAFKSISLIVFAIFIACLIMATALPLPFPGWSTDNVWGGLLSDNFGFWLSVLLIVAAITTSIQQKQFALLSLALPAAALLLLQPPQVSLDQSVFSSFLRIDQTMSAAEQAHPTSLTSEAVKIAGEEAEALVALKELVAGGGIGPPGNALRIFIDRQPPIQIEQMREVLQALDAANQSHKKAVEDQNNAIIGYKECVDWWINPQNNEDFQYNNEDNSIFKNNNNIPCGNKPESAGKSKLVAESAAKLKKAKNTSLAFLNFGIGYKVLLSEASTRAEVWTKSVAVGTAALLSVVAASLLLNQASLIFFVTIGISAISLIVSQKFAPESTAPFWHVALNLVYFSTIFIGGRIVRLFLKDNLPLWNSMSNLRRRVVGFRTILWWIPLGAAAVAGMWASSLVDGYIEGLAYTIEAKAVPVKDALCTNSTGKLIAPVDASAPDLEIDIDSAVRCVFLAKRYEIAQIDPSKIAGASSATFQTTALEAFEQLIPASLPCNADGSKRDRCIADSFNYPSCVIDLGLFEITNPICKAKTLPHRLADATYLNQRARASERFSEKVANIASSITSSGEVLENDYKGLILREFDAISFEVREKLTALFRIWDFVNVLSIIIFAMAVAKSIGYIAGRVVYNQGGRPRFSAGTDNQSIQKNQIVIEQEKAREVTKPGRYFVRLGAGVAGAPTKSPAWPQFGRLTFARFPYRILFSWFDLSEKRPLARFTTTEGRNFVRVDLEDGQEVAFSLSKLYSFSSNARFRRRWVFQLGNLIRGRASVITVTGPCQIWLLAAGNVALLPDPIEKANVPHPPSQLLVWPVNGDFTIDSELTASGVYMGDITLLPAEGKAAAFDADSGNGYFGGALRFVPMLLTPI